MTSMEKFKELLGEYSFAQHYWNLDRKTVDLKFIKERIRTHSRGQQIILAFLVAVFTGIDHLGFNITQAASILDPRDIDIICVWMKEPFWP